MNSSKLTHFSLLPKICSHWSSKQCQFGFSRVMSVPVSSMSHFHPSATSSPADGRWHLLDLFLNYISVEIIWFIWSMLCNQQPCTPTRQSNQLTTQATVGASSLLMLATPTDPGTSHTLSVWRRGLSRALSVLSVLMLTVAASTRLTRSSSTIAATSLPTSNITALPAAQMDFSLVKLQTLPQKLICPQYAALLLPPSIPILAMVPYLPIAVSLTFFQGWVLYWFQWIHGLYEFVN